MRNLHYMAIISDFCSTWVLDILKNMSHIDMHVELFSLYIFVPHTSRIYVNSIKKKLTS